MRSDRPGFVATPTIVAVVVATIAGLLQAAPAFGSVQTAIVTTVLAAAMIAVATAGMRWAERQPGDRALHGALAVYGALVVAVAFASRGRAFVTAMPFVSMLVLYLPLRIAALGVGGLTILLAAFVVRDWGFAMLPGAALQIGAAESFVVIFSVIARRERYARAEVERLQRDVAVLATTRERGRVARELHDSLGHYLTVMSIQLEALAAGGPPEIARTNVERLERIRRLVREALAELRRTVTVLRSTPDENESLQRRLEILAAEHRAAGLDVGLTHSGAAAEPPPNIGDALFRVAQEALTNVHRHARAAKARVALANDDDAVRLEIADDGVGRSEGSVDASGLTGLRERVTALGGTLTTAPSSGDRGFRIVVEVPRR